MYPKRRICICVVLALCALGVTAEQEDKPRSTQPATGQTTFGLGVGGRPTARRLAASQAATRAVALCSGLWSGGRSIEQINADNGGLGGTESMKTDIDYSRRIVSIRYSDVMPPRIVAWRPVLPQELAPGTALNSGFTAEWRGSPAMHIPQAAARASTP